MFTFLNAIDINREISEMIKKMVSHPGCFGKN